MVIAPYSAHDESNEDDSILFVSQLFQSRQKKYGGYYTQEEVKEIITYAEKRHITIIPEIEMPGHSQAAFAAYPNPSNGLLQIEGNDEVVLGVRVRNVQGAVVSDNKPNTQGSYDLSHLSKGAYILGVETKTGIYYHKIIIE